MSIIYSSKNGWAISHSEFIKRNYTNVFNKTESCSLQYKKDLFMINLPYLRFNENINKYYESNLKRKRKICEIKYDELKKTVDFVSQVYNDFYEEVKLQNIFNIDSNGIFNNEKAKKLAEFCYNEANKNTYNTFGSNGNQSTQQNINNANYVFPINCRFYCKDITEIGNYLAEEKFKLILLDPPWWNKFIRRKKNSNQGYQMMHNLDLGTIPINNMLESDGLVVIWCTNSPQHLADLVQTVFPLWGVQLIATWFWVKVTRSGEPICKFSDPPKKQPFERIIFARRKGDFGIEIPDEKIVISVPSSINSHKPPLVDLLVPYIGKKAKCLEIFARYLLPEWTSWGLEAIKLQHICLYE